MGGGLMQLVAHGAQDVYLTGDPQITYFKVVYRRHTNFSMESIQQQFSQTIDSAAESKSSCIISRNGDLIGAMYLQYRLTHGDGTDRGFSTYITDVEIEIGGQKIDKHYGRWLDIWDDLSTDANKDDGLSTMLGNKTVTGVEANAASINNTTSPAFALVPLSFWFNKNVGLALPLIALQYHEVKLNFTFPAGTNHWDEVSLWVDYIFLDSDERKRFAQMSHEYLIDQVQFGGKESFATLGKDTSAGTSERFVLHFNHPVKELIWICETESSTTEVAAMSHGSSVTPAPGDRQIDVYNVKLQINGHDRFYPRCSEYFRLQQPYQFHSTVPTAQDIYVYSFALRPEEHQPSGTCNFSRIDSCSLTLTRGSRYNNGALSTDGYCWSDVLYIYAINYNVLRIASGMAGLAYSN